MPCYPCTRPDSCIRNLKTGNCRSCMMKQRHTDPAYKARMIEVNTGKKNSEEFKAKMSAIIRARFADPEYRKKLSAHNANRWKVPGFREKFIIARRRHFAPWCPVSYYDRYFIASRKIGAAAAKELILAEIEREKNLKPSFRATPIEKRRAA